MTNLLYMCMKLSVNKKYTHVGKELLTHLTTVMFLVVTSQLPIKSYIYIFETVSLYDFIFIQLNIFKFCPLFIIHIIEGF